MDNHTAVTHEFTRKCLRIYTEDLSKMAIEKLEQDLPEYAETILHGGGYDLDKQIAALQAERAALSLQSDGLKQHAAQSLIKYADAAAESEGLRAERDVLQAENTQLRARCDGLREALKPFAEYAATLTNWDSDPVVVAKWSGILVTAGDFRKAAAALESP